MSFILAKQPHVQCLIFFVLLKISKITQLSILKIYMLPIKHCFVILSHNFSMSHSINIDGISFNK